MKNHIKNILKRYKWWYIFMMVTNIILTANLFLYAFTGLTFLQSTEGSAISQTCIWFLFMCVIVIALAEHEHTK